ncbi:MAG: hypothetical protein KY464_12930 [Gemmatimonadetes bacterium]|nr:hypothetical protein [Gemmatimonadota bacterium]
MQRLLPRALIALLLTLPACGKDGLGPESNEMGTYELVSVNGKAPPTPFFAVEVVSATIKIEDERKYQTKSTVRARDNLGELITQTSTGGGTYTRTGNTLQLTSRLGKVTLAVYAGRTLTVDEQSVALVYRRTSSP